MTDSNVDRKGYPPDESDIRRVLGDLYPSYKAILTLAKDFDHEWKYYGTKIGWQIKAVRKGKALFYLAPLKGSFKVGLAVRENEREALLHSDLPAALKAALRSAKKYREGYPLRLAITKQGDMRPLRVVFEVLKELR